MKERESQLSLDEIFLNFKTDLSLNNYSQENFEHKINISERKLENLKSGENITEEVFEFMILDHLTSNPLIKTKTKYIRNFMVLSERFLYKIFRKDNLQITKQINFINNYDILDKKFIYIPIYSEGRIWNLALIENLNKIFDKNPPEDDARKPLLYFFLYEKLQGNQKDILKKISDGLNIFLKSYFQYKSESDIDLKWKDYKTISVNNFETVVIKLKNFQSVEDTGLICFKIMSECLAEIEENSAEFIEKTEFDDFCNEATATNYRNILCNKITDAMIKSRIAIDTTKNNISFKNLTEKERHKEIIKRFITKKSPSLNSVGVSLQSRKRMNAALEGYFGGLARSRQHFNKTMFDESLFASGFDLDKPSRLTTYTQQELYDHNPLNAKYNAEDMSNQTKQNVSSMLKKPLHSNNSDRDDMSSNFNIHLMHANNGDEFNNISGVLNEVNASLLSYQNTKRNHNENIIMCKEEIKEEDSFEMTIPRKPGEKINQLAIDLSKNDVRNMELLNHNVKSPFLNSTNNCNDTSKEVNFKTGSKKEETKTEKFFFSFEKDAQVHDNKSKINIKKFSSKEVSTEAPTERKNKIEYNIGNPIITVTKKIPKTFNKKDINLIEEILNTQNEFQTNEDIEINHTSFNNNITYVRSFPFSNSNQYNSLILINSGNENENEKTSPHNKTTTAFSKTSDVPFLETQMQKEHNRIKESAKMREIIQSFSDEEQKILQIEDTKEYSDGPCDTCAKQCLIF